MSPDPALDRALAACVACVVSAHTGIAPPNGFVWPEDVFKGTRGRPEEAFARQVVVYILEVRFKLTMSRAAQAIGRHRTSATHARDVIGEWAENDDTGGADRWLIALADSAERAWIERCAFTAFATEAA